MKFRSSLSPVLGPYRAMSKNDRLGSDLSVFGMFWPRLNREQLSLRDEKDWHKVVAPYNISANNMLAAKKLSKTILAEWLVQYADGEQRHRWQLDADLASVVKNALKKNLIMWTCELSDCMMNYVKLAGMAQMDIKAPPMSRDDRDRVSIAIYAIGEFTLAVRGKTFKESITADLRTTFIRAVDKGNTREAKEASRSGPDFQPRANYHHCEAVGCHQRVKPMTNGEPFAFCCREHEMDMAESAAELVRLHKEYMSMQKSEEDKKRAANPLVDRDNEFSSADELNTSEEEAESKKDKQKQATKGPKFAEQHPRNLPLTSEERQQMVESSGESDEMEEPDHGDYDSDDSSQEMFKPFLKPGARHVSSSDEEDAHASLAADKAGKGLCEAPDCFKPVWIDKKGAASRFCCWTHYKLYEQIKANMQEPTSWSGPRPESGCQYVVWLRCEKCDTAMAVTITTDNWGQLPPDLCSTCDPMSEAKCSKDITYSLCKAKGCRVKIFAEAGREQKVEYCSRACSDGGKAPRRVKKIVPVSANKKKKVAHKQSASSDAEGEVKAPRKRHILDSDSEDEPTKAHTDARLRAEGIPLDPFAKPMSQADLASYKSHRRTGHHAEEKMRVLDKAKKRKQRQDQLEEEQRLQKKRAKEKQIKEMRDRKAAKRLDAELERVEPQMSSDSDYESDREVTKVQTAQVEEALRDELVLKSQLGVRGIPSALRGSADTDLFDDLKFGKLGNNVHLRSLFISGGFDEAVWMPASAPASDKYLKQHALLLMYFQALGQQGKAKRSAQKLTQGAKGELLLEDKDEEEGKYQEVVKRLYMLAMGRLHFLLHLTDPDHHAILQPGEFIGAFNYVLWLAAAELETKAELLVKLDT